MSKRCRFGVGAVLAVVLATILGGTTSAVAQDITRFQNGYLTFTNENQDLYYRVEFRPNLTSDEAWDGQFRALRNIQSLDPEVTVPVGVFYRVVGRDTPWVGGTASSSTILAGHTAYVSDEEITGTMANVGQTNITPGAAVQVILQGYHDGTGEVAGDENLVAENIKKDVTIFGVTGSHEGGGAEVPKTGQTNSYATGDDGDLEKGVAWPSPRFTENGDQTVTDNMTGLMWTKNANLTGGAETWDDTIAYCTNMNAEGGTYGYTDWRLPNVRELQSLIDYGRNSPALPSGYPFTAIQQEYWSSSTHADTTSRAWLVNLNNGIVSHVSKTYARHVWPVRTSNE
jgi:hypothetical protein